MPIERQEESREDDRIKTPPGANLRIVAALASVRRADGGVTSHPRDPFIDEATRAILGVAGRLQQQGRSQEAITTLEQFGVARTPTPPAIAHRLAVLFAQAGDLLRAERYIQLAIEVAPENEEYQTALKVIITKLALRR